MGRSDAMSTTTAADIQRTPMRELTIAEWHDLYGDYEGGHCELCLLYTSRCV